MRLLLFLSILYLAAACLGPWTGRVNADVLETAGVCSAVEPLTDTERTLSTFNEAVVIAVLLAWSAVLVYYLRPGGKTGSRRKTGGRRARR